MFSRKNMTIAASLVGFVTITTPMLDIHVDHHHSDREDFAPINLQIQSSFPGTADTSISSSGGGYLYAVFPRDDVIFTIPSFFAKGQPDYSIWKALNSPYEEITDI